MPATTRKPILLLLAGAAAVAGLLATGSACRSTGASLVFACRPDNDLFAALAAGGRAYPRFDSPAEAVARARPGAAALLLADGYPEKRLELEPGLVEAAARKHLKLYVEYPGSLPGLELGAPRRAEWERAVVASDALGGELPRMSLLAVHACRFLPAHAAEPILVLARVAGYDKAVFGLPKESWPLLFEGPDGATLVAATKLSGFVTARYAPAADWETVWRFILKRLDPEHAPHAMKWEPVARAAFGPRAGLPADFESRAFSAAVRWLSASGLLPSSARRAEIEDALRANRETEPAPLGAAAAPGDGSLGLLEGYASGIEPDGSQRQRLPIRSDCQGEAAMLFALDSTFGPARPSGSTAGRLLDFLYFDSDLTKGPRGDPHAPAFGLVGWGSTSPLWLIANYGDDNARSMLGALMASACLESPRWDESIARELLANFRTTGRLGFRGDRIDLPDLAKNGWRHYYDGSPVNCAPHFESYLWAVNLLAYRLTGFRPLFDRTATAIGLTMKAYPGGWRWKDYIERARMLLCLAWLVRLENTPEHRGWLERVAGDLLVRQGPTGSIHEWFDAGTTGFFRIPASNEAYGTSETPLIQENGNPASDQLYTTGFALIGLHEAAAALGDPRLRQAEDRLGEFLCRIQIRAPRVPWLDGWWFRAFDDKRWEAWASSADAGWGAWSLEAGWAPAWTAATLALRVKKTTFWDFVTARSGLARAFAKWRPAMLPD